MRDAMRLLLVGIAALAFAALAGEALADEPVKIGVFRGTTAGGPLFLAQARGYFAAEHLAPEIVTFDAGEAVAVATVAGAIDFGAAGTSAALYNLASQGKLRVIGGMSRDVPAFPSVVLVASKQAAAAGLTGFGDLPGHSVALTTVGSTFHYVLALIEQKYGFDAATVRVVPAQGLPNVASAVVGGQVDAAVLTVPFAATLLAKDEVVSIGLAATVAPWQVGVVMVTPETADKHDLVERYMRAFRAGLRDYRAAFVGPGETRQDGPGADEALAIIAKGMGETPAQVDGGISYMDDAARIDARDVQRQIDWYRGQGMVKGKLDAATLIDTRSALLLP